MSLRSQRLARKLDPQAEAFLDSTPEDAQLALDDVLGSLAHVQALLKAKILNSDEAARLSSALRTIHVEVREGRFKLDPQYEDIHFNVESRLTKELGDLGKKLHTGRSRNDQVALDLRLFARRWSLAFAKALYELIEALRTAAKRHEKTILPGYTHLQVAQPVLLSFHLLAHVERFQRDLERLQDAYRRANVSPLGAGALSGTKHPVDPESTATILGFDNAFRNAMDAVSDRDFVAEFLFVSTLALTHASGLAEEVILFTSQEFGFASLRDDFSTGSSIMPQKKNPDVFEVTRGRAAALLGSLVAALATVKNLPLAYNRDLQDQKRVFVETYPRVAPHIQLLAKAVAAIEFNTERTTKAAERGYGDATELADYLVERGVPFRDAHEVAATAVRHAIDKDVALKDLDLATLRKLHDTIGADVKKYLGAQAAINGKRTHGSTHPSAVEAHLSEVESVTARTWTYFEDQFSIVHRTTMALLGAPIKVKQK